MLQIKVSSETKQRASSLSQALVTVRAVDVVCPVYITDGIEIERSNLMDNLLNVPV